MPYVTVEVKVDLDDFTTEDLVEELKRRDWTATTDLPDNVINKLRHIYHARLCGYPWEDDLDRFLKDILGRAI